MKVFLFDAAKCNGCYGCQIACKDEHCEQDWSPYAAPQPITGQYWLKLNEEERGRVPFVHVDYKVGLCGHCDSCKLLVMAGDDDTVYQRDDGFILIDPEKARGRRDLADACEHVYWNEALGLPQKCTACAHLLDDGWKVPRCVDFCSTGALQFGEMDELDLEGAVPEGPDCRVFYKNLPKRRICGTVADRSINEVIIGAKVTITDAATGEAVVIETDELGDFIYKNAAEGEFDVLVEAPGYAPCEYHVTTVDDDAVIGEVLVER